MKNIKRMTNVLLASMAALWLPGCESARSDVHRTTRATEGAAESAGHFAGHVTHKIGEGIEDTGSEIERHTQ
jgi:hypothetical protein